MLLARAFPLDDCLDDHALATYVKQIHHGMHELHATHITNTSDSDEEEAKAHEQQERRGASDGLTSENIPPCARCGMRILQVCETATVLSICCLQLAYNMCSSHC